MTVDLPEAFRLWYLQGDPWEVLEYSTGTWIQVYGGAGGDEIVDYEISYRGHPLEHRTAVSKNGRFLAEFLPLTDDGDLPEPSVWIRAVLDGDEGFFPVTYGTLIEMENATPPPPCPPVCP